MSKASSKCTLQLRLVRLPSASLVNLQVLLLLAALDVASSFQVLPYVAHRQSLSGGSDMPDRNFGDSEMVSEEAWRNLIHTDMLHSKIPKELSDNDYSSVDDPIIDEDKRETSETGRHEQRQIKEHLKHLKEVHMKDSQQDSNAAMSPSAARRERQRRGVTASPKPRQQLFMENDDFLDMESYVKSSRKKMIETVRSLCFEVFFSDVIIAAQLKKSSPGLYTCRNTTSKLEVRGADSWILR
eukprot:437583-Hanusia_phi.AAC.2